MPLLVQKWRRIYHRAGGGPHVMANRLGPTSSAWRRNSLPGTPIAAVVRPRRCREAPTIPA